MTLLITPTCAHPTNILKSSLEIKTNPLIEKISEYAVALFQQLFSFQTGDLSHRFYEVIQFSLSTMGCAGYALTLLILIGGFPKLAFCTVIFSTGNFVGAYVTHQATVQQSLAKSAKEFEKHLADLSHINTELKITSEDLKKTNEELKATSEDLKITNMELRETSEDLKITNIELRETSEDLKITNEELQIEVRLFAAQNSLLKDSIKDLGLIRDALQREVCSLREAIQLLEQSNQELKQTSSKLENQVSLFSTQNKQFRSLAKACKEGAQQFFSGTQANTHTQAQLLQKLAEQIESSDQLWAQIHKQMDQNCAAHAAIIEQQMEVLSQMRNPELHDALKKDIQEASQEFRKILEEIHNERIVLEALKHDHQKILARYGKDLEEREKQTKQMSEHVASLKPRTNLQAAFDKVGF